MTRRLPHLLVTGFGPFPTMPRNPSAALAEQVAKAARWRLVGARVEPRILTTAYAALDHELGPALGTRPDAVLLIGVAGRSKAVRVERRATARRSTLFPDVTGEAAGQPAARRAPRGRQTSVKADSALRTLHRHGLLSRVSQDSGRYLCNTAYFRALAEPCPVLFVHIPNRIRSRPPRARARLSPLPPSVRLRDALVQIGLDMLRDSRRARPLFGLG